MGKQASSNGGSNSAKGNQGSVGANTARSEQGRERKTKIAKLLDTRRETERQDGSFYLRVNAGRSSDINAAAAGAVGLYAYPGGDQPSVHFNVQKEASKSGAVSVIRLESIQVGHALNGASFSDTVFLPCFYIEKFGSDFVSRLEDRLAAATQQLICFYFTDAMGAGSGTSVEPAEIAEVEVSENLADALNGVSGFYRHTDPLAGSVVLEVFQTRYPVIRIDYSDIEGIDASRIFLPLNVAMKDTLSINDNLPEEVALQQQAIFDLLKPLIAKHKASMVVTPAVKHEQKVLGAKELAKAAAKRARAISEATAEADKHAALAAIRKVLIPPHAAVTGKLGFMEMTDLSGSLIVHFGMIKNDRIVVVEHIGENHMLRLAGVNVGTRVFAGQVLNGLIDRIDAQNMRMSQDDVKRGNALISHIRSHFAANGIHLHERKAPDLKKVA